MNLNKVFLTGRLTRDPEHKKLENGTDITTFGLATSSTYKNRDGEKVEDTEFHNVVVFGGQAAPCADFLKKGSLSLIVGKLKTRSWEKDGVKHYRTEVVADDVVFGPLSTQPKNEADDENSGDQRVSGGLTKRPDYPEEDINPDDIPFS